MGLSPHCRNPWLLPIPCRECAFPRVASTLARFQNLLVEGIWPTEKQPLRPLQAFPAPWGPRVVYGPCVVSLAPPGWVSPGPLRQLWAPFSPRPHDYSADGFNDWAFMTTHSWDEDPSGEWVLEIENTSEANNYGIGDIGGLGRGTRRRAGGLWDSRCCAGAP